MFEVSCYHSQNEMIERYSSLYSWTRAQKTVGRRNQSMKSFFNAENINLRLVVESFLLSLSQIGWSKDDGSFSYRIHLRSQHLKYSWLSYKTITLKKSVNEHFLMPEKYLISAGLCWKFLVVTPRMRWSKDVGASIFEFEFEHITLELEYQKTVAEEEIRLWNHSLMPEIVISAWFMLEVSCFSPELEVSSTYSFHFPPELITKCTNKCRWINRTLPK